MRAATEDRAGESRATGYIGDGNPGEKTNNDGPTDTSFKRKLGMAYNAGTSRMYGRLGLLGTGPTQRLTDVCVLIDSRVHLRE
jgi:YD repeat-containing protein